MIPYSYNMVDMGGIDLAEANGTVVPGVYEKIVEAMNLCGDLILYNWKFAGININPSAYAVLQQASSILINGLIQVTELDQITVLGIEPPPPPIVPVTPLEVTENGIYEAEPPASGFNPVTVSMISGEYIRYRVYDNNSTLFEEYFQVGSSVVIHRYIYAEGNIYELDINEVAVSSVDVNVYELPQAQTNYNIVQLYLVDEVTVRGRDLVVLVSTTYTAGIVFSGSVDARVLYNYYTYRQCGRCKEDATLPDVQNRGAGRTYYVLPANNVEAVIPYIEGQNFFASGSADGNISELIIKNFVKEE